MDRVLIGTRKGLFDIRRSGGSWRIAGRHFLGEPVTAVVRDGAANTILAALALGHFGAKVWRSDDDGANWREVAAPAYPPKPADSADKIEWTLKVVWVLESGGRSGVVWAGTLPGGLFRSTDSGESWEINRGLWGRSERAEWFGGGYDYPGIHSICVYPANPEQVLVGVSCGGAWLTRDGGQNWEVRSRGMYAAFMPPARRDDPVIQDPHRIVQCAAQPDVFWCQHHNGVFRSTDDAASWHEVTAIKPSTFGFAVAVHPRDPQTAWFVPAKSDERRIPIEGRFVVARTDDGGKTCEVLAAGLPGSEAYDLVYRHGLAVAEDGRTLAMASTTGGVWFSGDAGESWRALNARLPPVNCVRFA
jgi:hypothetical protein